MLTLAERGPFTIASAFSITRGANGDEIKRIFRAAPRTESVNSQTVDGWMREITSAIKTEFPSAAAPTPLPLQRVPAGGPGMLDTPDRGGLLGGIPEGSFTGTADGKLYKSPPAKP